MKSNHFKSHHPCWVAQEQLPERYLQRVRQYEVQGLKKLCHKESNLQNFLVFNLKTATQPIHRASVLLTSLFRKKCAKKDRCIQLHYMRQGPAVDYQWWSERHYLKRGLLGDCTHNYWGSAQIYTQLLRIEQNTNWDTPIAEMDTQARSSTITDYRRWG